MKEQSSNQGVQLDTELLIEEYINQVNMLNRELTIMKVYSQQLERQLEEFLEED